MMNPIALRHSYRSLPLILPALLLAVTAVGLELGIFLRTGHFVYPLDDPYIHLAMARHFAESGIFGVSLAVITVVAIAAVHWPDHWQTLAELAQGYALTDNGFGNFKLPVFYLAMLLPLILQGPGRLSLDAWIRRRLGTPSGSSASALPGTALEGFAIDGHGGRPAQ